MYFDFILTDFAANRTVRVIAVIQHGRGGVTATAATIRYDGVGYVWRAGWRGGRRIDGQPVVVAEALDAGDVVEQGGTTVTGRCALLLRRGQMATGRAACGNRGVSGGR